MSGRLGHPVAFRPALILGTGMRFLLVLLGLLLCDAGAHAAHIEPLEASLSAPAGAGPALVLENGSGTVSISLADI